MKETRLAAVMFTDIAGFSSMMEDDEKRTIDLLEQHNELVLPLLETFGGKLIDSVGDGLLVTFDSVLGAVSCALSIQNAMKERNDSDPDNCFYLRIGLHLGDIWIENDRIYGNGVNIASRIQNLARPGGVCISEDVYIQVKNKEAIQVEEIPHPELKNINREFKVYHLHTGCEKVGSHTHHDTSDGDDPLGDESFRDFAKNFKASNILGEDFEGRLGKRISGFVEKTLDAALGAWDDMPQEKKSDIMENLRSKDWFVEIDGANPPSPPSPHSPVPPEPGKGTPRKIQVIHSEGEDAERIISSALGNDEAGKKDISVIIKKGKKKKKKKEDKDDNWGTLVYGLIASGGLGWWAWTTRTGWPIFLFFLLGILPLAMGTLELVKIWFSRGARRLEEEEARERQTLQAARQEGGSLTVVQLSAITDMSFNQAQSELDKLAKKGWVQVDVADDGAVYYRFPSLIK